MLAAPDLSELVVPIGLLILAVVALTTALLFYRARLLGPDRSAAAPGRLLDGLRAMRDRGELTPEEYDAAARRLAHRLGATPSGGPPPPGVMPPRPATPGSEIRRARPGFDLAGDPLPRRAPEGEGPERG